MPRIAIPLTIELPEPEVIDVTSLARGLSDGSIDLVTVLGPTASGKTKYAVRLAKQLHDATGVECEIISADSRQVFRGMDIGTGKDLCEYDGVAYHLIDILPAGAKYNVYDYQRDFAQAWKLIRERGHHPILCGGTGLYIQAVTTAYDFGFDKPRVPAELLPQHTFYIGTLVSREERVRRIDARLDARLEEGMVEEIRGLIDGGVKPEDLIWYGLEYKFVTQYVTGEISYEKMRGDLAIAIHQFAKRQMTWFRGMERHGIYIHWTEV